MCLRLQVFRSGDRGHHRREKLPGTLSPKRDLALAALDEFRNWLIPPVGRF
jgi:hypothetical protein